LTAAKEEGNEMAEQQILGIIKRERERSFWRRLKYKMGRSTGGSVQAVQVEDEKGNTQLFTTQEEVHEAIWSNVHRKRFFLAEAAPICKGELRDSFGYNADTGAGEAVLSGTFEYSEDFELATKKICHEVTRIRECIPQDSVEDIVRKGEWQKFWRRAKEDTSSSESGLHFSHYKAAADSDLISHFHAMKGSVMIKTGYGYERWGRGLSVMLEKILGCQLISKLRSILLMEADFNCLNKIIFGC
jgi:predicted transcriptional regulator